MNFLFFLIFFEVDITGVCAAICLGVDTPQVTPFNPCTWGGSYRAKAFILLLCHILLELIMARLEIGGAHYNDWGCRNFRLRLNVFPFKGLPTEPDIAS